MKSGYHICDSRNIQKKVKNNSVDVIITSPPYWDLKDYEAKEQIGRGQKYQDYLLDIVSIFDKCFNVVKSSGSMWIIIDTLKKGNETITLPFDLVKMLKEHQMKKIQSGERNKGERWFLQDIIIWEKNKTLPWSHKGKVRKIFEYILFFTKTKKDYKYFIDNIRDPENLQDWWKSHPERYNPKGKVPTQIWEFDIITQGWGNSPIKHACPFPSELVERIILLTTKRGDMVLDPFAGSGSVLAQAHIMKRKYLGFDLNENYKKIFDKKVLPLSIKEEKEKESKGLTLKKKQEDRAIKIINLRKLKYAKEILRYYLKENENIRSKIDFIFVHTNNNKKFECEIYYVLNENLSNKKVIKEKMDEIRKTTLLRKYELKCDINFILKNSFIERFGEKTKFFKYKNSKFQHYTDQCSMSEFTPDNTSFPDILSNIKLRVK